MKVDVLNSHKSYMQPWFDIAWIALKSSRKKEIPTQVLRKDPKVKRNLISQALDFFQQMTGTQEGDRREVSLLRECYFPIIPQLHL